MLVSVHITKRPKPTESIQELRLFPHKNLLNLFHCLHLPHFFVSKNGNTEGTGNQIASSWNLQLALNLLVLQRELRWRYSAILSLGSPRKKIATCFYF